MPSGYPDWHKGVKSDIIAQTIDKIRTSIDAVTVDKFEVDLVAQSLDKLSIDIVAQSVDRLIQAPSYGCVRSLEFNVTLAEGERKEIFRIVGEGIVHGGFFRVFLNTAGVGYITHMMTIDDNNLREFSFALFNTYNITQPHVWLIYKIAEVAQPPQYFFAFTHGITFDLNYAMTVDNNVGSGDTIGVDGTVFYALR